MNISTRKIYIGLLSPTVSVHRLHWRYINTLPLQFVAERIWTWRWKKWHKRLM